MLNVATTLAALILWITCFELVGRRVASLLHFPQRTLANAYLSPLLGCAAFVLVATSIGWACGFPPAITRTVTGVILAVAVLREKNWRHAIRGIFRSTAAVLVISTPLLIGIYRFQTFNVFNDTFTYLVHGQWLQTHAFHATAQPEILAPAYSQVTLYQTLGLRMGGSFFLGWIQSANGWDWSLQAYPVAICLLLTVGGLGVGALSAMIVPGRRRLAFAWALAVGTTIGGFGYGTMMGFLPQTAGLAFMTGLLALLTRWKAASSDRLFAQIRPSIPLAVTFAAAAFCYSEILPFLLAATGIWFLSQLVTVPPGRRASWWRAAAAFAALAALLVNLEFARAAKALITQSKAVVGWPVPWTVSEFLAHSLGLRSGSGDSDIWVGSSTLSLWLLLPATGLVVAASIVRLGVQKRTRLPTWSALFGFVSLCGAAFVYFRWQTASPWPVGLGQTWNQFKLSNWIAPVLLGVVGAAGLGFAAGRARIAVGCIFCGVIAVNLLLHAEETPRRLQEVMRLTGRRSDPFAAYLEIREKAKAAEPGVIYLDLGDTDQKSRQIAAYFLHDFQVAADWTGDSYIYPWLPRGGQLLAPSDARWKVARREQAGDGNGAASSFEFTAMPRYLVTRESVVGGHGVETDASGWWVWSAKNVRVTFNVHAPLGTTARVRFVCIATSAPYALNMKVFAGDTVQIAQRADVGQGWQRFVSAPFQISAPKLTVEVEALGPAAPLGEKDIRVVAMLVKNVTLEFQGN